MLYEQSDSALPVKKKKCVGEAPAKSRALMIEM